MVSAVWAFQLNPHPGHDPWTAPTTRQARLQCQHRAASPRAQAELQEQELDVWLTEYIFGSRRAINTRILNHLEHLHSGEQGTGLWQSQGWCGAGSSAGIAALAQPCHEAPAQPAPVRSHADPNNYKATSCRKGEGKMSFLQHIQSRIVQYAPAAPLKALETGFTLSVNTLHTKIHPTDHLSKQ